MRIRHADHRRHPSEPTQTGAYKRSVRNYLLDSRFQLKYTGFLVFVAIVISGVMGAVLYTTTRAMVGESQKVVAESAQGRPRRARRSPRSAG